MHSSAKFFDPLAGFRDGTRKRKRARGKKKVAENGK